MGTVLYMSPAKLDHYHHCLNNNLLEHNDVYASYVSKEHPVPSMTYNQLTLYHHEKFHHNPFSSDMYSFGLVIMRLLLHNLNVTLVVQIENIFYHNRELLQQAVIKNPYYYHPERFILFEQQVMEIKSLLQILLDPDEQSRGNILDIVLMLNTSQNILISISTPHPRTFQPKIEVFHDYIKVIYDVKKYIIIMTSYMQNHIRGTIRSGTTRTCGPWYHVPHRGSILESKQGQIQFAEC